MRLAEANFTVLVVGRSQARGNEVVDILRSKSSDPSAKAGHRFVALDSSLVHQDMVTEVRKAAAIQQRLKFQGCRYLHGWNGLEACFHLQLYQVLSYRRR
jgi:hypothetical protein